MTKSLATPPSTPVAFKMDQFKINAKEINPDELKGKGYYYPTLQYHEPISTWLRNYSNEWGEFLSTEESWNDEYYETVKNDSQMNMKPEWYGDKNIWKTFNEWFSRSLIDPSARPISDSTVVAPADSTPQGVWDVDENGVGGITVWDPELKKYILEDSIPGWQMIETRDCYLLLSLLVK